MKTAQPNLWLPLCIITGSAIFLFDICQPLGVAGGVPYVLMVSLGLLSGQSRVVIQLAVLASVLTIVGCLLSEPGGPYMLNRGLALLAIWSVAGAMVLATQQAATLGRLVFLDPLTGVYNRRYLQTILEREVEVARRQRAPLSVVMVDIDHFKSVNDRFGHHIGDRVLQQVAKVCGRSVRASDWVCRYGGEEFAIVLPSATFRGASMIAERIRRGVERARFGTEEGIRLSVSLGVAQLTDEDDGGSRLLAAADHALYRSKAEGRNKVTVSDYTPPLGDAIRLCVA